MHYLCATNFLIMVKQCTILFGFLALGELIIFLTGLRLPSSIVGMLLLTASLHFKLIKLESIKGLTDFLISNMAFFFVPSGVALMCYFDIISAEFWPIVVSTVLSLILVLVFTGWTHMLVRRIRFPKLMGLIKSANLPKSVDLSKSTSNSIKSTQTDNSHDLIK